MAASPHRPPLRRSRWFQFRLATLLLLITGLGIWLGLQVNRVNRQRRAVAEITARKGIVGYDYQTDLNPKTSEKEPPGPKWLRQLIGDDYFCEVECVDFATDYFGRRKELGLSKVDDDGLACLELIPKITTLELGNNRAITDAGLVHLRNLNDLSTVYLYRSSITGPGLAHLADLPALKVVDLKWAPVTNEGLVHLGRMKSLTAIVLDDTQITDDGLVSLQGLTQLKTLRLNNTAITDAGLRHLRGMSGLEELSLRETDVSDAAVAELKWALPKCRIATGPAHK
jgi:hypothetical protein